MGEDRKFVLCFLLRENKVLFGWKTQKIGEGCWNGPGGEILPGETEKQAVRREVSEEVGIIVDIDELEKVAILKIDNSQYGQIQVHVFLSKEWEGEPRESNELVNLEWFLRHGLPLNEMMPADKHWLPWAIIGKRMDVWFEYDRDQKLVGGVKIKVVENFPEK